MLPALLGLNALYATVSGDRLLLVSTGAISSIAAMLIFIFHVRSGLWGSEGIYRDGGMFRGTHPPHPLSTNDKWKMPNGAPSGAG